MTEINASWVPDEVTLYKQALHNVIRKAHSERAKFPLRVTVTNANEESWDATVVLRGRDFDCRHNAGEVLLKFPLEFVAVDSRGDQVASNLVNVLDPKNLGEAN